MASGFNNSFEKAFAIGQQKGSDASLEMMKEKIKKEAESAEKALKLANIKDTGFKLTERMVADGGDPKVAGLFSEAIAGQKDADIAEKILTAGLTSYTQQAKDKSDFQQTLLQEQYKAKVSFIPEVAKSMAESGKFSPEQIQDFTAYASERAQAGAPQQPPTQQVNQSTSKELFSEPLPNKIEQETTQKKTAEKNVARGELSKDLEDFFLLDDQIKRSDGGLLERTTQGVSNVITGLQQNTAEGFSLATHDAARKKLRVKLVRAAGDVGNMNVIEQVAAEQIIPSKFDSKGTAKLKRAMLQQASKALDSDDAESEVKKVLNDFAKSEAFKGPKGAEAKKLVKTYKVGDTITLGKNKYKVTGGTPTDPELEVINA